MVRVFMRANTIMKMTRVVTLLFSDKKSEEEKGAVEWILLMQLCFKMQKKATQKKEVFGDVSEPLFSAPDERADKNAFFVFGF